jgi:PAS domain S-box-containing protein
MSDKPVSDFRQETEKMMSNDKSDDLFIFDEADTEMILIFDLDGKISYVNEKGAELTGYFEDELLEMNITDILTPDEVEKIKAEVLSKYASGDKEVIVHEAKFIDRSLKMIPAEINSSLVTKNNKPASIRVIAREFASEKDTAEQAHREKSEKAEPHPGISQKSEDEIILTFDMKEKIQYANEKCLEITGYFEDELLEMNISDILPPDQVEEIKKGVLNSGGKDVVLEVKFIDRSLKMLPMQTRASLLTKDGKPDHIRITAYDGKSDQTVSREPVAKTDPAMGKKLPETEVEKKPPEDAVEKKVSEPRHRPDENKYRLITEAVREMLLSFDMAGNITYINERGAQMIGYFKDELSDMNISDILPPEQLQILKRQLLTKPVSKNRKVLVPEARFINKESKIMHLEATSSLIMKGGSPSEIVILGRDLSRRKKMEKEIIRAQKFESLATLAGGLVDELNNALTGILGNIDLAQMELPAGGKAHASLSYAKEGCTKLKDLIRQFIIFSKGGMPNRETASFAEFIKASVNQMLADSNVKSEFFIVGDLWSVAFDERQMKQAIYNLLMNAREAMPDGGRINIYAENMTSVAARKDAGLPMEDTDYVKISVRDSGEGIREEHLGRIFDPYFTTKKKGRGLGLTSVYSVIRKHYGYIYADSKPGDGTVFHIYLPASKKEIPVKKETGGNPGLSARKVLIMDDEDIVIDVAVQMIQQIGYEVEAARNGAEAIEAYKNAMKSGKLFNAVILDLHVDGGMGGKDAIREILKMDPNVKAIVSSGYSNDPEMTDFEKYGFSGVVEKPYSIEELKRILKNAVK